MCSVIVFVRLASAIALVSVGLFPLVAVCAVPVAVVPVLVDNTITLLVHVATVVVSISVSASIVCFKVAIKP